MKIATIVGARPQFIKAAAMSRILKDVHEEVLIHTGQHYDENMSEVFFKEMQIPTPKYNLKISGGSHGKMTGRMIVEIEKVLMLEKPDMVLLYGDTNSTLAGALSAVKLHIPVVHVEAGNRLGTLNNPEEVNRILTDHVSALLFCVTEEGRKHLLQENLGERAYVVGNIMYDSFLHFAKQIEDAGELDLVTFQDDKVELPKEYYYLTCHREENTNSDEPLLEILTAMNELDSPTIYPVHPRNQERATRLCKENIFENIILIKPVSYSNSVYMTIHAKKIVTDSGGLQCEAFYAGVQCVTIFDYVAWPETMTQNRNQLVKPNQTDILTKLSSKQIIDPSYQPFGDGHAAEAIVKIIEHYFN